MKTQITNNRPLMTLIMGLVLMSLPMSKMSADESTPLCFTAKSDSAIVVLNLRQGWDYYQIIQTSSTNDGTDWEYYMSGYPIVLANENDKVYFRASEQHSRPFGGNSVSMSSKFVITGDVEASGNIMSLYGPTCPNIQLPDYAFADIFYNCSTLLSTPELPSTNLSLCCYANMFQNCTSLTSTPTLPATTVASGCYGGMFKNCISLTAAPNLPAMTMKSGCYGDMFSDCVSLVTAPDLPATTLDTLCYGSMFTNCTLLTKAPDLPAPTLALMCYSEMFKNCTSLREAPNILATAASDYSCFYMFNNCVSLDTAPALYATALGVYCYVGMFTGCTSLVYVPDLPATTLADNCYDGMFGACTSLVSAPALPATTLASSCYSGMFYGCTSLVSAPALPATNLARSCYRGMFGNCTSLASAPTLPASNLTDYCYSRMFNRCTSLINAPILSATNLADYCYEYMFSGCTSLITAPVLPATTMSYHCYENMFRDCSSLVNLPALPATTLADGCYKLMFSDCSNLHINVFSIGSKTWKIPSDANVNSVQEWNSGMFLGTAGTFTGDPQVGVEYYIDTTRTVTALSNDTSKGYTLGSGLYAYNDTARLTARPKAHCRFVAWSNGKTDSIINVSAIRDTTLIAYFEEDTTCSTIETNENLIMSLYPNPINIGESVYISASDEIEMIEVYSIDGRCQQIIEQQSNTVSIEGFNEAGVYIVKITCLNGKITTRKLIVK